MSDTYVGDRGGEMSRELRDFIGRQIAFYEADKHRRVSPHRREAQVIALAEVLRFMDGDMRMSDQLAEMVPLSLADLPKRLGGVEGK